VRLWPRRHPITRLRLRPGDALVVNLQEPTPVPEQLQLADRLRAAFPDHLVVVVPPQIRLSVIEQPDGIPGAVKSWPTPRVREL